LGPRFLSAPGLRADDTSHDLGPVPIHTVIEIRTEVWLQGFPALVRCPPIQGSLFGDPLCVERPLDSGGPRPPDSERDTRVRGYVLVSYRGWLYRSLRSRPVVLVGALATLVLLGAVSWASIITPAAPADTSANALDTATGAGSRSIITLGPDRRGLVAYHAGGVFREDRGWSGTGRLKVAHCNNIRCTSATITTVAIDVGLRSGVTTTSGTPFSNTDIGLAFGQDGLPIITYFKGATADLMAVHCNNLNCSTKTITAIVTAGDVGRFSSVAIGPDGLPVVAYYDASAMGLRVARCADVACTSASVEVVDDPGGGTMAVGLSPRIVIGPSNYGSGSPVIAYLADTGATSEEIRVATCPPADPTDIDPRSYDCSEATTTPVIVCTAGGANLPCGGPDIVIGADGLPFVTSFFDARHCETSDCTQATAPAVASDAGGNTSPAVGVDGLVTYLAAKPQAGPRDPSILHCQDLACSSTTTMFIDDAGAQDHEASLTVGADGNPLISTGGPVGPVQTLQVIHCSNPLCVPFFRRR
jgi:hypothetical protein